MSVTYGTRNISRIKEVNNSESRTRVLGYINKEQKIRDFINAGAKLLEQRIENYDGKGVGNEDDFMYNPLRDKGTDFSDYKRHTDILKQHYKQRAEEINSTKTSEEERIKRLKKNIETEEGIKDEISSKKTAKKTPSGGE
ncbi:MAG: hypothetical protein FWB95_04065 [Treponema sp.]|nr:hypothetical protein [Treponema sp.]